MEETRSESNYGQSSRGEIAGVVGFGNATSTVCCTYM
jgi:hypothetical protein